MTLPDTTPRQASALPTTVTVLLGGHAPLDAQAPVQLQAGDSVRIELTVQGLSLDDRIERQQRVSFAGLSGDEIAAATVRQENEQRASDQKRGAFFLGLVGASAGLILAKRLSVGRVDVHPLLPVSTGEPRGVSLSVPSSR